MSTFRRPTPAEMTLLIALLKDDSLFLPLLNSLCDLQVTEMDDGGMGSLRLIPKGSEGIRRSIGRRVVLGEFTDKDGVPVSISLNLDTEGKLFELDSWKVNFAPLLQWPDPAEVKIIRENTESR